MNTRIVEMDEDEYAELRRYARLGAERRTRRTGLLGWIVWGLVAAFIVFIAAVSTPYYVSLAETFGLPHLRAGSVAAPSAQPAAPTAIVAPAPAPQQRQPAVVAPEMQPRVDASTRTRVGLDDNGRPYAEREERRVEPAPEPTPLPLPTPAPTAITGGIIGGIRHALVGDPPERDTHGGGSGTMQLPTPTPGPPGGSGTTRAPANALTAPESACQYGKTGTDRWCISK